MSGTTSTTSRSHASRAADQIAATATPPTAEQIAAALAEIGVSAEDTAKMVKATQPKAPKFSVKRYVARQLLTVAADMVESWDPAAHEDVSQDDARKIVAQRLAYGPTGVWDDRLGERSTAGRRPKQNGDDDTETAETE
jgi:ribosomal protein L7/L12